MRQIFTMDSFAGTKEKIKEIDNHLITGLKDVFSSYNDLQKFMLEKKKQLKDFKETGNINILTEISSELKNSKRKPGRKKLTTLSSVIPSSDTQSEGAATLETSTRPRRKASVVAANSIKKTADNDLSKLPTIKIKVERISDIAEVVEENFENVVVKQESVEMPPPSIPQKKTRTTKQKVVEPRESSRSRRNEDKDSKDSEEIVKPPRASTRKNKKEISYYTQKKNTYLDELEETSDEDVPVIKVSNKKNMKEENRKSVEDNKNISSDRTENKRSTSSRKRSTSASSVNKSKKKTHGLDNEWETEENADCEQPSIYEDAASVAEAVPETVAETFASPETKTNEPAESKSSASKKLFKEVSENEPIVNATFVIEKNVENETDVDKENSASMIHTNLNVTKVIKKHKKSNDQKFTETKIPKTKKEVQALEKTPVRKKIEAFEKMGTPVAAPPMRITRTKSKKQNKENAEQNGETATKEKNKTAACTPLATNRILPSSSTMSQTMSALKASKEYFLEREKRRKEKETEALKKKEALKQSQLEEKRRIREEKEQKAKLQREALEKEKQMLIKEKQKRLLKQREEIEKKKLELKLQKSAEKKQAEEKNRLEAAKLLKIEQEKKLRMEAKEIQGEQQADKPIYLTTKAPLLPTYDCYDTDEDNTDAMPRPMWTHREKMRESVRTMMFIDDKLKNTLFCLKPQTVDLTEIFQNIDPRKLRRNSSAIWKTQPRFTLMDSHCEF